MDLACAIVSLGAHNNMTAIVLPAIKQNICLKEKHQVPKKYLF